MKEIHHPKGKIYYSMGEVCEMFDVNASLIRFWESKFTVLRPLKNKKGNRQFTPQDVDNLNLIYHLVKEKGMTLAGAEKRIRQNREGLMHDLELIDRLQKVRSMLVEIREELRDDPVGYITIAVRDEESASDDSDTHVPGTKPAVGEPKTIESGVVDPTPVEPEIALSEPETAIPVPESRVVGSESALADPPSAAEENRPYFIEQTLF